MHSERPRILIVDDEKVNITVLVALLEDQYDMLVAKDGEQALKRANSDTPPDLILLDVIMPGMDGYTVCETLKADPKTANIPVIFITVKSTEEEETRGFGLGAVDYISKPFSPAITKARVATHIELKQQRDILEQLNTTDGLTGIANRRRFDDYLDQCLKTAARTDSPMSLLLMDIDHFKPYNDNYGHQAGDDCLRQVAQALAASSTRTIDLIARYGGEEFAAILPGTDMDGALVVAENMRRNIEALALPHAHSGTAAHVTLSIGIATDSMDGPPLDLVKLADEALYRSKESGRNKTST